MSRRLPQSLRQLLPLAITALLIAGCGRSPHSESDVVAAFEAQGVKLQRPRFVAARIPDDYALKEVTSVLVRPPFAGTDSELIVRIFASAAAAGRSAGSPIVENVRLRTQGCELIARFNVVAYACRGQGLSLASVREAMATLD